MANQQHDPQSSELIRLCLRYTSLGLTVCLLTGCFLGWPLLVAAAGLIWDMWHFCSQTLSAQATDDHWQQGQSR
ncbi:hypothetical protein [Gimesia maris]|uniref:hypothetical protein n=1 Tax=Gimesia maris TaxID=122 RepID=UPI0001540DC5|nr:hypothetical protein [Gimesia maris]EDL62280.1 hypothetical protein PM8797T_28169 [Gimesia maris DSM 8797]QGQ29586.1 hypothetical protein F1729_13515 [Gimesia maris]